MASVVGSPRTPLTGGHSVTPGSTMASGGSSATGSSSLMGGIGGFSLNSATGTPIAGGMPSVSSSSGVFGTGGLFVISGSGSGTIGASIKPVPMKLFATWEVDRTPSNCIPRLCSLTLTRLVLNKSLGPELNSVIIAVKMQSSKRTLRSNEIVLPSSGLLDTELELTFSLQYPHFLKREGNQLHIMLQRRKKYKNRTILGFKTLAVGIINMSQVLQKQMDLELELYGDAKEKTSVNAIGKVYILSLSSQPVDHEESTEGGQKGGQDEPVERVEIYSDEEDYTSAEEGSDSEPMMENPLDDIPSQMRRPRTTRPLKGRSGASKSILAGSSAAARQRNIRQKFVALLKRFKVPDPEDLDQEQVDKLDLNRKLEEASVDPAEIEDLFDQLESLSDSDGPGIQGDSASIGSTPKPSLKPFFNSSRNLLHEAVVTANTQGHVGSDRQSDDSSKEGVSDSHPETLTDPEFSDPPVVTSSPPQSGDEVKGGLAKDKGKSRLFTRDKPSAFSLKQQKIGSAISSGFTGVVGYSGRENRDQMRGVGTLSGVNDYRSLAGTNYAQTDNVAPRKVLLEQLSRVLPSDSDNLVGLPDQLILANTGDKQAAHVATKLEERGGHRVVCTAGPADVRATLTCLVAKLQRFCNTKTQSPPLIKVVLIGGDTFVNSLLRTYVEVFSSKPPDWQSYLRFFIVPLGGVNTVAKYIGSQDSIYSSLFLHDSWREILEKAEPSTGDVAELVARVEQYVNSCGSTDDNLMHLPIAEAMVTYKEKSSDEESNQVFIPFISDVRVKSDGGVGTGGPQSFDGDDNIRLASSNITPSTSSVINSPNVLSVGPITSAAVDPRDPKIQDIQDKSRDRLTPPSSPHVGSSGSAAMLTSSPPISMSKDRSEFNDPMDLQLDYWMISSKDDKETGSGVVSFSGLGSIGDSSQKPDSKKGGAGSGYGDSGLKASIKTSIWRMQIHRLGVQSIADQPTFSMQYWLKEKKSKAVMRLGKRKEKEKDHTEVKSQGVDGITRLICLSKGQNTLKVHIDGLEWCGVKFFQLSSQWQTHIKHFPVAIFKSAV